MNLEVVFSTRANDQLPELYEWLADIGDPARSEEYVSEIISFCEGLGDCPGQGRTRDDVRPGMRTVGFRRRVVVAFAVTDSAVEVLGIFYGGQGIGNAFDL